MPTFGYARQTHLHIYEPPTWPLLMYTLLREEGRRVGEDNPEKTLQSCESSLKKLNYPLLGEEGGEG